MNSSLLLLCFITTLSLCCWTRDFLRVPLDESDIGIKLTISEDACNRMIDDIVSYFTAILSTLVLSDITGEADVGSIAVVDYSISEIEITSFSIDSAYVKIDNIDETIPITVTSGSIDITFKWEYTDQAWPYVNDQGTGVASCQDLNAQIVLAVGRNECYTYDLDVDVSAFSIGDIDLHLSGGASWLYDIIIDLFLGIVSDLLQDNLPSIITAGIQHGLDSWSDAYEPLLTLFDKDGSKTAYQDWRLPVPSLSFSPSAITLPASGQCFPITDDEPLFWQRPLPLPDVVTDDDVQYIIDRSLFNTILSSFQKMDTYNGVIDDPSNPLLQTDTLSSVIPGLAEYPGDSLRITLNSTQDPLATIMPTAVYVNMTGVLTAELSGSGQELFQLGVSVGLACQLDIGAIEHPWGIDSFLNLVPSLYNSTVSILTDVLDTPLELDTATQQLIDLLFIDAIIPFMTDALLYEGVILPQTLYFDVDSAKTYFHDTYLVWGAAILTQ